MHSVKIRPIVGRPLSLGRQGEHLARAVEFGDIVERLIQTYGPGEARLYYRRPTEDEAYEPSVVTRDGDNLTWRPTRTDTALAGVGRCELRWYVSEQLAKTRAWDCSITESLVAEGENPDKIPWYTGAVEVTPKHTAQVLDTSQKRMPDDVTVREIQIAHVMNEHGGETVTI